MSESFSHSVLFLLLEKWSDIFKPLESAAILHISPSWKKSSFSSIFIFIFTFFIYILSVHLPHLSPSRGTTAPCNFLAYLRSSHTCYILQVTSQSNTLQFEPNSDYAVCYINNTELTAAEGLFQSFLKQMLLGSVESLESGEDTHQMLQEMAELHLNVTSCFHP